jgi:DNA-binding transcriptional regulator LsrR (DeoR family)
MTAAGPGHDRFGAALGEAAGLVLAAEETLANKRADLKRIARAAHAAGMTERQIAKAAGRSGPAVHAWLHEAEAK